MKRLNVELDAKRKLIKKKILWGYDLESERDKKKSEKFKRRVKN